MYSNRAPGVFPGVSEAVTIAPALTIGLSGRPTSSSPTMDEKDDPVGSTPVSETVISRPAAMSAMPKTSGLATLWSVKAASVSP